MLGESRGNSTDGGTLATETGWDGIVDAVVVVEGESVSNDSVGRKVFSVANGGGDGEGDGTVGGCSFCD